MNEGAGHIGRLYPRPKIAQRLLIEIGFVQQTNFTNLKVLVGLT